MVLAVAADVAVRPDHHRADCTALSPSRSVMPATMDQPVPRRRLHPRLGGGPVGHVLGQPRTPRRASRRHSRCCTAPAAPPAARRPPPPPRSTRGVRATLASVSPMRGSICRQATLMRLSPAGHGSHFIVRSRGSQRGGPVLPVVAALVSMRHAQHGRLVERPCPRSAARSAGRRRSNPHGTEIAGRPVRLYGYVKRHDAASTLSSRSPTARVHSPRFHAVIGVGRPDDHIHAARTARGSPPSAARAPARPSDSPTR